MKSKRPHILVVDDEEDNRNIITEYLQDDEFRFSMAEDGAIAWEILQQNPGEYDLILLDIMMPKLDGLELLARLKAHQALEQIPVILQTTRGEKYDIANGIEAGAFYYLTKPFHEEVLRSIVQTAISDHRKYLELKAEVDLGGGFSDMMRSGHFVFKTLESSRAIIHFLARACPQPSRVVNGLSELITNAIEHGNLQITYQQKTALIEHETWLQEIESR
ncbi:MAG: response regulator, partial [Gammaproteobacteria bacterium]|nr:response regulator [Gammaproteobacteria bacterium]